MRRVMRKPKITKKKVTPYPPLSAKKYQSPWRKSDGGERAVETLRWIAKTSPMERLRTKSTTAMREGAVGEPKR